MRILHCISPGIIIALLLACAVGLQAETHGPTLTPDEVRGYYRDLFVIEKVQRPGSDGPVVSTEVAELPADHPLADLTSNFLFLLEYILKLAEVPDEVENAALADLSFPDSYLAALRQDDAFDAAVFEIVSRFMRGNGGVVQDSTPAPVRTFSEAQLLRVAVRFIYPDNLSANGNIGVHYCSVFNGLSDLKVRDPYLEALAYSAIIEELHLEPSSLVAGVSASLKLAKELELSGEESIVLSRVQGLVWGDLMRSAEFRSMLQREYERVGYLLPISIQRETEQGPHAERDALYESP